MGAALFCAAHATDYSVEIEGAPEPLEDKLDILSDLKKGLRDYPTAAALRRAAARDAEAFRNALSAAGHYDGEVDFEVIRADEGDRYEVVFSIAPGPLFVIDAYDIVYEDDIAEDGTARRPASLEEAGLTPDGAADGAALRNLQGAFLAHLLENGYPAAEIVSRRAVADFDAGTATASFVFRTGPRARFGGLSITGLDKTNPDYLERLKTWEDGEEYERSKLVAYRDRLAATSLFSTINVSAAPPDETGAAVVTANVAERRRRTIGAGASFSTAEGPGGRLFFEHRNIFGQAETFRTELSGSEIEQAISFDIAKPLPTLPGQAFSNLEFSNETTDAFDARSLTVSGGLSKRWLDNRLETRAALALETSNVESNEGEERNYFVLTPLSVLWNSEDDLLDPAKGFQTSLIVTPHTGSNSFTQTEFSARSRIHFGETQRFTLAARGALGATFGTSLNGLPLNKRLFAGGGGSVRGFGFQEVGPLDDDNDPIGGRSLIEGAFEARAKVTRNIQLAAFVDAGSVSANAAPDFNEDFFVGYGGGVRYFTPIGPIRVDAAFPLDRRETDREFQIYIALGQAF